MHAIAHIEFNAINLALDAAYRFRNQTFAFYRDWIGIAADEARHFSLIRDYLNKHDCEYGDFQAHNGLWEMAVQTQHDIVARMNELMTTLRWLFYKSSMKTKLGT